MKQNSKQALLNSIGTIYDKSEKCKFDTSHFQKIDQELNHLSKYFNTSKSQAFFIAMVFALNYKDNSVDLKDLTEYFDCNPMKVLAYMDDFETLQALNILIKQKSSHRIKLKGSNDQFIVNKKISEAILQSKPMPSLEKAKFKGIVELLEEIYNLGVQRDEGDICSYELYRETRKIIASNLDLALIKTINNFQFEILDKHIYLYLIWKTIVGNESTDISRALEGILDNSSKRVLYMQQMLSKENDLIKNELIELVPAKFFEDTEMKLTDKSLDILTKSGIKLFENTKKEDNIIVPSEIAPKKLIYDQKEMKQLYMVKNLLQDSNLIEVQDRLIDKGLAKGITILLHGASGTGKTETSLQLAKDTNREIMKVEISKSKSMWFGESEKLIKKIFTDYKSFAKNCKHTPILLFNEADALISKRMDTGTSNVGQTENAIQNILLEELENFQGILIATTNLVNNLDAAFDRRFLFKIKFSNPEIVVKAKIWRLKLPLLSVLECKDLASSFDFSGGQIDNISRKCEINEIIHGLTTEFSHIVNFCNEELLINRKKPIGFVKP